MFLVLGARGFVGSILVNHLKLNAYPYIGLNRNSTALKNEKNLSDCLQRLKPSFLLNTAGFTGKPNVDGCESAKYQSLLGNAVLPGIIREVCEDLHIPWGHISSGCIYSGRRDDGNGWTEEDEPNFSFRSPPGSFYSDTKALGEEVLEGA